MPKKKDKNGEEFYRGRLREAEKQIRTLERQVRSLEKTGHIKKPKDTKVEEESKLICSECSRGEIKVLEMAGKVFHICPVCGSRKKVSDG